MPTPPDRFSETSPDPVDAGAELNVVFIDTTKADEGVVISIKNGEGEGGNHDLALDSNGRGEKDFTVPMDWEEVILNGPNSHEHVVSVTPP